MIDTSDIIQEPVTEEALLLEQIERYRIKAASEYAEKEYLLKRDGVGFSPRGNVMALSAEKKAGKTWFAMAMAAALLSGNYMGMISHCKDAKVLFFDTEQDESDGQRIQKRVHFACGWDFNLDNEQFQIFHLREINQAERRDFVCKAIEYLKPDFVIVDGIRDLLSDFNDLEQSAAVIQDFMRLSSDCKCAIWAVLHVNPNSEKMRGHLGTELGNKVADIIHMTKTKNPNNEDDVTYKAEEVAARSHKDIHSIVFRIDDSKPYGAPVLLSGDEVEQLEEDERQSIIDILKKYMSSGLSMSYSKIRQAVKEGEKIGSVKADRLLHQAMGVGILDKAINGKYILVEKPIQKTGDLPFEKTDEKDTPF